ncbi:MAG: hypothetical protein ACR2JX_01125 [Mycobacteriales bacterium]
MRIVWNDTQRTHLLDVSRRGPHAQRIDPEWTQEAVNAPGAWTDAVDSSEPYKRRSTGYSPSYGDWLTVVYLDINGQLYGITAYPA